MTPLGCERAALSNVRHSSDQLVERDRIVACAHAGRIVNRVGNRSGHAANAKLADALGLHGRGDRIGLVKENQLLMRDVGVNRHLVAGEVVIDEEAATLVDHQLFHQRSTHAHGHGTDYLAARRLRIQDAACRAYREHAPHADFRRRGIDADLDEMRAEGRLLILLVEITIFDAVFGREATLARGVRERHAAIA